MNVAVVGCRRFDGPSGQHKAAKAAVRAFVNGLPNHVTLISGGAHGVDTWAEDAADASGLAKLIFRPDWKRYGRRAAAVRNMEIVRAADEVVAFWDGKSRGTRMTIEFARKEGKPLRICHVSSSRVEMEHLR